MTDADPNYVNAVVRGDVPGATTSNVVIFCDLCGIEHSGDYIVGVDDDQTTRFGYARTHMRTLGWSCDARGDFCPDEGPDPAHADALRHSYNG